MHRIIFQWLLLAVPALTTAQVTAITNINVITMQHETVLPGQTVLIENGLVKSMGPGLAVPKKATVIDGSGRYLLPGLTDMHAHFFYEQGDNRNTCAAELQVMLANGITTARIMCGDSVYLEARKMVRTKKWSGPELFVVSPQIVGNWPWPGKVFAGICKTPADAEAAVQRFKAEGYDEIKITFMVKRDVYDAIIRTAAETGMKVTGHVGPMVKLPAALAAKQQVEHMDEFIDMLLPDTGYNHGQSVSDMNIWRKKAWETVDALDESKIPGLARQVKDAGIFVTPTNYFFFSSFGLPMTEEEARQKPDFKFIPPGILKDRYDIRDRYWKTSPMPSEERRQRYIKIRKAITRELWKAGVPLMAGSDSPEWFLVQGFALHNELETFVSAGLTPYAALQTATVNPARYMGIDNRKGTIAPGKAVDLLLLDGNPLEDIRHTRSISGVVSNGIYYSKEQLQKMLAQAQQTLTSAHP